MNKKKILVVALSVCLIAILSMGSLAWFSDSDSVQNKFMVANSSSDPDEIFSVDVWEKVDGQVVGEGQGTTGATYENIIAGQKISKEAYVENTGSYDQYIRVTLTLSDGAAWIGALGMNFDAISLFSGVTMNDWDWANSTGFYDQANDTIVFVLYYNGGVDGGILAPGEALKLFETITVPTSLTDEQAALFGGDFTLDIFAEAVQTENLGDGVDSAVEAFAVVEADQEI